MAVPYARDRFCRSCLDLLRGCCASIENAREHAGWPAGYCCECAGHTHTESRPGQETVTTDPRYL